MMMQLLRKTLRVGVTGGGGRARRSMRWLGSAARAEEQEQAVQRPFGNSHEVFNQAHELLDANMYEGDPSLVRAMRAFGAEEHAEEDTARLMKQGRATGSARLQKAGELANRNKPVLHTHSRYGERVNRVEFHPAYHDLMQSGIANGVCAFGWNNEDARVGSHVTRMALGLMEAHMDSGHGCPLVMTFASVPTLRNLPQPMLDLWMPKVLSYEYDPRDAPVQEKCGATIGMSMTEKQGGSDVRANTTIATPVSPQDHASATRGTSSNPDTLIAEGHWLTGHKWFTSAPMCDAFLTLAYTTENSSAPSCFLVPRWLPDGSRNQGFKVMRLKDKLGDHSNASSEVEYHDAWGYMVGEEGRGVRTIIDMVQCTRMECASGSSAVMRQCLMQALHHTAHRSVFGRLLQDQPLMQNVLMDLIVDSEASTLMTVRMAKALDAISSPRTAATLSEDERRVEEATFRLGTALTKYWVTKRQPHFVYECMECLGGNGYTEDFPLARHFRQSPLNAIWEGSGNVIALDVFRAWPLVSVLMEDMGSQSRGMDSAFDNWLDNLASRLTAAGQEMAGASHGQGGSARPTPALMQQARRLVDDLATALQGHVMLQHGDPRLTEAYMASRIAGDHGHHYGTLPNAFVNTDVLQEHTPRVSAAPK